jgi:CheY-like chemotaxis protein
MSAIVEGYIAEILFDIHQRWDRFRYRSALQLTYRSIPPDTLNSSDSTLVSIQVEPIWQQALQTWQAWQQDALAEVSPNLAPAISKAEELRWQTSPKVYQNLITLVDGHQTFRDLAVKLKQNLLPLTLSIMPYIRKGLIEVLEVGDLNYAIKPTTPPQPPAFGSRVRPVQAQQTSPLVAYIDDSRLDCQRMNHILAQVGYRCILIQDPVQALPLLLEHKPHLIFLDLIMPVTNGYEICSQVRRMSVFQDTPVIILTSNDGIVDRVRAKMVGSTGFLAKPIGREKVLSILQKYLVLTKPAPS